MADSPLILAFDTSTPCGSVALTRGKPGAVRVIGSVSLNAEITHSRRLLHSIDWLLGQTSLSLAEISAVAVGLGPGSFTGLRIGLATAKGLALGAGIPLLGVSSLDALAVSVIAAGQGLVCAILDARKKQVYGCLYRGDQAGGLQRCSEPVATAPERLFEQITEPVLAVGDGVEPYLGVFRRQLGDLLRTAPQPCRYPDAVMIGQLAATAFSEGRFLDPDTAGPLYVRASDAELSLIAPERTY